MSLKQQATSGFLWSFVQQFSSIGVGFGVSILMARLLTPAEFGLMGMIYVFFTIGTVLLDAGLAQSLIRTLDVDDEDFSTVFFFNVILGLTLYAILFLFAPFVSQFYNQPQLTTIVRVYSVIFILGSFATVQNAIFIKQMQFKRLFAVTFPATIIGGLFGVYCAYTGYGVWSLVYSTVSTSLFSALFLWIFSSWRPKLIFSKQKFRKHFNFGYKLTLTNLLDAVVGNIYQITLGKFFQAKTVGHYSRADSMRNLAVSSIENTLTKVSFPLLANLQSDKDRMSQVYKQLLQSVVFITSPILVLLIVLAEPIFIFLFTEKWLEAVPLFQIICTAAILKPVNNYNLNLFALVGRSDIILKLELIQKPISIALVLLALPLGLIPLMLTQILYAFICFFISVNQSKKIIGYNHLEQLKDIGAVVFIAILAACSYLLFIHFLASDATCNLWKIILGSVLFTVVYLSLAYAFKMKGLQNVMLLLKK